MISLEKEFDYKSLNLFVGKKMCTVELRDCGNIIMQRISCVID